MLIYTELGLTYIKYNKIYIKKNSEYMKIFFKYIIKVDENYILMEYFNLKTNINNYTLDDLLFLKKNNEKVELRDDYITISDISWAATIENSEIEAYSNNFSVSYSNIGNLDMCPIKKKIKNIEINQYEKKIKLKYQIKDIILVYFFINELYLYYKYSGEKLSITLGVIEVNWEDNILNISFIIEEMLRNDKIELEIVSNNFNIYDKFYYELNIYYNYEELTKFVSFNNKFLNNFKNIKNQNKN